MKQGKDILWSGSSREDLSGFPVDARRMAGHQLREVQRGLDPDDWKPFDDIGPGTKEIRVRDANGIYRVMYVAKFKEAIYVLHCFQKKTEATSRHDKKIAQERYRDILRKRTEK